MGEASTPGRLAQRRALVTGAAAGIGAATVQRLEAEGAHVVGLDAAPEFQGTVGDVANPEDVERAIASIGQLDICVANAGVSLTEPLLAGEYASWERLLRVNLLGVMVCFQAATRAMVAHGRGGRLLATASIAGIQGESSTSAYSASKSGVIGLVRSLSVELAPHAITVNAVAPGQIDTALNARDIDALSSRLGRPASELRREHLRERVPAGRMGTPAEVAGALAFLASDEAAFVTGEVIRIDGGEVIA